MKPEKSALSIVLTSAIGSFCRWIARVTAPMLLLAMKPSSSLWTAAKTISVALAVLFIGACSQSREDSTGSVSEGDATAYSYPHPTGWSTEHLSFISKQGQALQNSKRNCNICHATASARPMNVSCAISCHAPTTANFAPPVPSNPNNNGAKCMSCHNDHFARPRPHYPAGAGLCSTCHEASNEHISGNTQRGVVTRNTEQTCYSCHFRVDRHPQIHAALNTGASCANCHDPHGTSERFLLKAAPQALCLSCHDMGLQQARTIHGPMQDELSCLNCHTPHSSDYPKLLMANNTRGLCMSCHTGAAEGLDGKVTRPIGPDLEKAFVHGPAQPEAPEGAGCVGCHSPHASSFPHLAKRAFPEESRARYVPGDSSRQNTYAMCFQCHNPNMLNRDIGKNETKFRNDTAQNGRIVRKNLHWYHVVDAAGNPNKEGGRSCATCHDMHGTEQQHNIRSSWPMSPTFDVPINYTATPTSGECTMSCHDVRRYRRID